MTAQRPFHDKILAHGRLNGPTIACLSGEPGTRGTASRRVRTDDPACPVCGGLDDAQRELGGYTDACVSTFFCPVVPGEQIITVGA